MTRNSLEDAGDGTKATHRQLGRQDVLEQRDDLTLHRRLALSLEDVEQRIDGGRANVAAILFLKLALHQAQLGLVEEERCRVQIGRRHRAARILLHLFADGPGILRGVWCAA